MFNKYLFFHQNFFFVEAKEKHVILFISIFTRKQSKNVNWKRICR